MNASSESACVAIFVRVGSAPVTRTFSVQLSTSERITHTWGSDEDAQLGALIVKVWQVPAKPCFSPPWQVSSQVSYTSSFVVKVGSSVMIVEPRALTASTCAV